MLDYLTSVKRRFIDGIVVLDNGRSRVSKTPVVDPSAGPIGVFQATDIFNISLRKMSLLPQRIMSNKATAGKAEGSNTKPAAAILDAEARAKRFVLD